MLKPSSPWWFVCYLAAILLGLAIYGFALFSLFTLAGTMTPHMESIVALLVLKLLPLAPLLLIVVLHIRAVVSSEGGGHQVSTTPKWYLPVAILAMLWNMAGWAAYLDDVMLHLYSLHPTWRVAVTAVAVWAGLAGSIGLIMRKRWATPVLIASLVGVLLQGLNLFVLNGAAVSWEVPGAFVMQGMVLLIAIGLVLLARKASAHGWLG